MTSKREFIIPSHNIQRKYYSFPKILCIKINSMLGSPLHMSKDAEAMCGNII